MRRVRVVEINSSKTCLTGRPRVRVRCQCKGEITRALTVTMVPYFNAYDSDIGSRGRLP